MSTLNQSPISIDDAVALGAHDGCFFGHTFFPRAFKQESPYFHKQMDDILLDPETRYASFMMFRGSAKTTKTRCMVAQRISYAVSRVILVVGKSQEHAMRTVRWIKKAVEWNDKWTKTFQLSKGGKWSDAEIEIVHGKFEDENGGPLRITVLAVGMTGSIRGINIEDMRPDFIIADDPCDEENTGTPEQRKKTNALFFGALEKSLAPKSENPYAMMVLLQTILNSSDLISLTVKARHWRSLVMPCFDEKGESVWPERKPTKELLEEKQNHIDIGELPLWLREMECKCVSEETASFKTTTLQFWDTLPEAGHTFLTVDPTPPAKDKTGQTKLSDKLDDAVIMAMKALDNRIFVCEYYTCKSPDPDEFITKLFDMSKAWKTKTVVLETILFQRMVKWALEKRMQQERYYLNIITDEDDKRHKPDRIRQEVSARANNRMLYIHKDMTKLQDQFTMYPDVNHDDVLDALSIGCKYIQPWMLAPNVYEGDYFEVNENAPRLENWRSAP